MIIKKLSLLKKLGIAIIFIFTWSCQQLPTDYPEVKVLKAVKGSTEYIDGIRRFYHEYDNKDKELFTIFYNGDTLQQIVFFRYDTAYHPLMERIWTDGSFVKTVKYDYEYNEKKQLISSSKEEGPNKTIAIYNNDYPGDTIVKTVFRSQQDYEQGNWYANVYTDRNYKVQKLQYSKAFGGGPNGQTYFYSYNDKGMLDKSIHFYSRYDTIYFNYNDKGVLLMTDGYEMGKKRTEKYEYNEKRNLVKKQSTEVILLTGEMITRNYLYKWKELR